jgi:Calx-beta domain
MNLMIGFTVEGTATEGTDYPAIGQSVMIPKEQTSVKVMIKPILDQLKEGSETVILTLQEGSGYQVGTPNTATMTITENPPPCPKPQPEPVKAYLLLIGIAVGLVCLLLFLLLFLPHKQADQDQDKGGYAALVYPQPAIGQRLKFSPAMVHWKI